jgi:hypothetical protein
MSQAARSGSRTLSGFERLPGVTAPTNRQPRSGFLSDTVIEMGLVGADRVEAAVTESRSVGMSPETLLVHQGLLSAEDLARARAEHAGLDYVDLDTFQRDHEADGLVGRAAALRFSALPIAIEGRALVVALADPFDAPAIAGLADLAQREVTAVVASASEIEVRIEQLPERTPDEQEPLPEPVKLQTIHGGAAQPGQSAFPDALADRIIERVDAAVDEVARSELLKALDEATAEIEELSAKLEECGQRARALERERDELRADLADRS